MTMMDVVRIDTLGSRDVMKFRKFPIPSPGPNEILLKVKAATRSHQRHAVLATEECQERRPQRTRLPASVICA